MDVDSSRMRPKTSLQTGRAPCTGAAITGIGTDCVSVLRFRRAINRWGERFVERIFTGQEIDYCRDKLRPEEHFAGRFAAKEAVYKALPQRVQRRFGSWREIEIAAEAGAGPWVLLHGQLSSAWGATVPNFLISIAHSGEYAIAFAVLSVSDGGSEGVHECP